MIMVVQAVKMEHGSTVRFLKTLIMVNVTSLESGNKGEGDGIIRG